MHPTSTLPAGVFDRGSLLKYPAYFPFQQRKVALLSLLIPGSHCCTLKTKTQKQKDISNTR